MLYPPLTPDQERAMRASYERRQLTMLALTLLLLLLWGGGVRWATMSEARGISPPLALVLGGVLAFTAALIAAAVIWQCPRCGQQFGQRFVVRECGECHLRLE